MTSTIPAIPEPTCGRCWLLGRQPGLQQRAPGRGGGGRARGSAVTRRPGTAAARPLISPEQVGRGPCWDLRLRPGPTPHVPVPPSGGPAAGGAAASRRGRTDNGFPSGTRSLAPFPLASVAAAETPGLRPSPSAPHRKLTRSSHSMVFLWAQVFLFLTQDVGQTCNPGDGCS